MRIYLRCGNAFRSQHLLHRAEVSASFHQVGRKGMAKSMGRNIFGNACFSDEVFNDQENHHPGEPFAAAIEKQDIFFSGKRLLMRPHMAPVDGYVFRGAAAYGYQSFLVSLPDDPDKSDIQV